MTTVMIALHEDNTEEGGQVLSQSGEPKVIKLSKSSALVYRNLADLV